MASSKFLVFWNILLIFILLLAFEVASRELLEHSMASVMRKVDRQLNEDFPWGHGYHTQKP